MRLPATALALAVLLAPAASAAWSQAGGDAAHAGRASLGELDVVGRFPLLPDGLAPADPTAVPAVVDTGAGLVALARDGGDCVLVRIALDPPSATPAASMPCPQGGRLAGWDAANQRALVCIDGVASAPLLQAWGLDAGEAAWTRAPALGTPDPLAAVPAGAAPAGLWSCRTPALEAGAVTVAFSSQEGRNRVERLALADGAAQWSTAVPSSVFLDGVASVPSVPGVDLPEVPLPAEDATGAFAIASVVATTTGAVAAGRLDGTTAQDAPPGLAWFDATGTLMGAYSLSAGGDPTAAAPQALAATSRHGAANGPLAAHLVGDALVVVNPANAQGTTTPLGNPSLGQTELAAPCWSRDVLAIPGEAAAFLVPSADPSTVTTWGGFQGGRIQACAITGSSLWALVTRDDNGTKTDLLEVGLLDARSLRRVPLPLRPANAIDLAVGLLPLDDGRLLAWTGADAVLLAPAATTAGPGLRAESRYPAAEEAAAVTVTLPAAAPDGTRLLLAWGDGLLEEVEAGRHSHTYGDGGERTVRATLVQPDGNTSTTARLLHVGAAAPEPRGLLEIAFDPDNQNYTFTIIGFLVTLIGALVAAIGVHRGRHRLDRHLRALDRVRDDGRRDPFAAVRQLHLFREERRHDLAKGRLEDAQYVVLESAAGEVLQILRQRILGTYVGRVSDRFSHALDLALADGDIDEAEGAGLMEMATHERDLTAPERTRLGDLVRSWQRVI